MKIAFITFEYPPFAQGGAGVYAENITKELARLGNEVHVITPKVGGSEKSKISNGIFIHRINFINKPLLSAPSYWIGLKKQFKIIEKNVGGFDIVHGNAVSDLSLTKRMVNVPRIITVHHLARDVLEAINPIFLSRVKNLGGEIGMTPFIEKICIERADKIIAVSEYTKRKLESHFNVSPRKMEVIYNGLGKRNFELNENEKNDVKEKCGFGKDKPVLLFVGRIDDKRKGLDFLLNAFEIVLSKIDVYLVIVGSGNNEPYKRFSSSSGIGENVIFTGYVDDLTLRNFYSMCDIHVVPSRLEGFGLTILDAMAAGKPVVTTNVGAIPEIVKNGENGILVELNDINGMSNAICTFLQDKKLAENVGKRNVNYVKEKFNWEKSAKEIERLYMQLAGVV
jgi:glycosyltransferase involved in cell wall biosynthesis